MRPNLINGQDLQVGQIALTSTRDFHDPNWAEPTSPPPPLNPPPTSSGGGGGGEQPSRLQLLARILLLDGGLLIAGALSLILIERIRHGR